MAEDPRLATLLERASRHSIQLTQARRCVMESIAALALGGPFTPTSLEDEVQRRAPQVGRATVFRTVKLLREAGILTHLHMGPGHDAYVICHEGHHHHLICNGCGTIHELESCGLDRAIAQASQREGFAHQSHVFDIYGLCARCQKPTDATAGAMRPGQPVGPGQRVRA